MSAPNPLVRSEIKALASDGSIAWWAPRAKESFRRAALGSTTIIVPAPATRTHCNVLKPIGPAPCITATSPSLGGFALTA